MINATVKLLTSPVKATVKFANITVVQGSADGDALAFDVLAGKTFSNAVELGAVGTMTNHGNTSITPTAEDQPIGAGYHGAGGLVLGDLNLLTENIRAGATIFGVTGDANVVNTNDADAVDGEIVAGKTAYVAGTKVIGAMVDRGAPNITPSPLEQPLSAGYYSGGAIEGDINLVTGNIKAGVTIFGVSGTPEVVDTSDGYVYAEGMVDGTAAYAGGAKVIGTMPEYGEQHYTPGVDEILIPAGHYNDSTVNGDVNLDTNNIKAGVTIFGVAGSTAVVDTTDSFFNNEDLLIGSSAYTQGVKGEGTMPNIGQQNITPGATGQAISQGYHDGTGVVAGDADLIPGNIKAGSEIFGVTGDFAGEGAAPNGSRIFSSGELIDNVAKGDIVSVRAYLARKTASVNTRPTNFTTTANSVAMSADGNFLVYVSGATTAPGKVVSYKWAAANNRYEITAVPNSLPTGSAVCNSVALTTDGSRLVVGHNSVTAPFVYFMSYAWVSANNRYEITAAPNTPPQAGAACISMTGDGERVVIGLSSATAANRLLSYVWSAGNNRYEITTVPNVALTGIPAQLALSSDGARLAVAHAGSTSPGFLASYAWSAGNNRYEQTSAPDSSPPLAGKGCVMTADGARLAISGLGYVIIYTWESANNRYEYCNEVDYCSEGITKFGMAMSSDGLYLAVGDTINANGGDQGGLHIYKYNSTYTPGLYQLQAQNDFSPPTGVYYSIAALPDFSRIACCCSNPDITPAYLITFNIATVQYYTEKQLYLQQMFTPWIRAYYGYVNASGTAGQTVPVTVLTHTRKVFEYALDPV